MPWAADDIAEGEQETLAYLAELAREDVSLATKVVEFPWAADAITEQEQRVLRYISSLTRQDVALGVVVAELP